MLTEKQQKVLDVITDFVSKHAKSPTINELQNLLNQKSKRGVVQYLESLEKKWFITRTSSYRWIRLWNSIWLQTMLQIPILGVANAWQALSYAEQYDYWTIPISKTLIKWNQSDYFIVKVDWTSMNDFKVNNKYIENGSYVLINKNEKVMNSKDAFLFIVDGAATLKVPKKEWNNIYLMPKSKDSHHKPIVLSSDDEFFLNWKVVDVFNFD